MYARIIVLLLISFLISLAKAEKLPLVPGPHDYFKLDSAGIWIEFGYEPPVAPCEITCSNSEYQNPWEDTLVLPFDCPYDNGHGNVSIVPFTRWTTSYNYEDISWIAFNIDIQWDGNAECGEAIDTSSRVLVSDMPWEIWEKDRSVPFTTTIWYRGDHGHISAYLDWYDPWFLLTDTSPEVGVISYDFETGVGHGHLRELMLRVSGGYGAGGSYNPSSCHVQAFCVVQRQDFSSPVPPPVGPLWSSLPYCLEADSVLTNKIYAMSTKGWAPFGSSKQEQADFTWSSGDWSGGAEGDTTQVAGPEFLLPGVAPYCLIGKVGESGAPFYVGSCMEFTPVVDGVLYLGMNDTPDGFDDNSGWLSASVTDITDSDCSPCEPPVTRQVPSAYATIQDAIDACCNGDTIMVAPGIYTGAGNHNLVFGEPFVVIRSTDGPEWTVLDCQDEARAFIVDGAGTGVLIEDLTIRNGSGWPASGGGVLVDNNAYCYLRGCQLESGGGSWGGGVMARNGAVCIIENSVITNNTAGSGGGIAVSSGASLTCWSTILDGNSSAIGSGLFVATDATAHVDSCLILNGSGSSEAAVHVESGELLLTGVTVRDNSTAGIGIWSTGAITVERTLVFSNSGAAASGDGSGTFTISDCNVYGNSGGDWIGPLDGMLGQDGNLSANPWFCEEDPLLPGVWFDSPCLPTNNDSGVLIGFVGLSLGCPDCIATWTDVAAGDAADPSVGGGVSWVDYDGDGDQDLYLTNDDAPNRLLRNDGGSIFVDVAVGLLTDDSGPSVAAWGDADNDGDPDLYLA